MLAQRAEADPMSEFFAAIKSPVTKRKYELRLRQFFAWVYGDKKAIIPARKGVPLDKKIDQQRDAVARTSTLVSQAGAPTWTDKARPRRHPPQIQQELRPKTLISTRNL